VLVTERLAECRAALDDARATGRTVGLVPTMGALHAGHRALIDRAAATDDVVAVTIFVNPLQFGDPDDLAHYPRPLADDLDVCRASGAAVVAVPAVEEMYPGWPEPLGTTVGVPALARRLEGASRPGHFDGVATVVTKLFAMAGACRAYFGEKDFQQLALVRRLVADLSLPVDVVGCPTVRDPDGLALSSRNVRLSAAERQAALALPRALAVGRSRIGAGERRPAAVERAMAESVADEPLVELDYAVVVDAERLEPPPTLETDRPLRLLAAAAVGSVRLIDNCAAERRQVGAFGRTLAGVARD